MSCPPIQRADKLRKLNSNNLFDLIFKNSDTPSDLKKPDLQESVFMKQKQFHTQLHNIRRGANRYLYRHEVDIKLIITVILQWILVESKQANGLQQEEKVQQEEKNIKAETIPTTIFDFCEQKQQEEVKHRKMKYDLVVKIQQALFFLESYR